MPHYIAEVRGRVAIWSTVVDAPITPFVGSLDRLRAVAYHDRDHLDELLRADRAVCAAGGGPPGLAPLEYRPWSRRDGAAKHSATRIRARGGADARATPTTWCWWTARRRSGF